MWDPAAHHTPALPKLRIMQVTVLGCTNLATRDAQRANNPFVWVYVDGVPLRTCTADRGGINPEWKSGRREDFKNEGRLETPVGGDPPRDLCACSASCMAGTNRQSSTERWHFMGVCLPNLSCAA